MHAVLAWGSQVCFDSHSPMRHWTHWNTIAWKAQTHTSACLQLLSRVSLWMFECILYACSWPCPNYYGGDVGPATWFQQASGELGDVCRRICERKSKPVPPGAAVIRQQSSALGTASAYDSLLVPRYLLPLPSSNSPRVKMRDTFEANVMRCLFLFYCRLRQGGKTTHAHIDEASFEIWMEKETLGFYVTALVCFYRYISGRDAFKEQLRRRRRKTIINLQDM